MVLLLYQEATCSNLVFSRVLCFFETRTCSHPFFKGLELIHISSCSHPFNEWPLLYYKGAIKATHFSNLLCFCRPGIVARRYHSYQLWWLLDFRYVYIERNNGSIIEIMDNCKWCRQKMLFDDITCSYPLFLWYCHYFKGALETIHMSKSLYVFHITYCNHSI